MRICIIVPVLVKPIIIKGKESDMQPNQNLVYLKLNNRIQSKNECIVISDVATVVCQDKTRKKTIDSIKIMQFEEHMDHRQIIGILWIIQKIQQRYPDAEINTMGPCDVIVEYIGQKKNLLPMKSNWFTGIKILFVSLISFFGGAFSIMAFHNDIGISELFANLYLMMTGKASSGYTVLEIFYSIGLIIGIVIFFNHIGKRRITKDPTPIEVAMRMYEQDVNTTMCEAWNREGKSIDVS
jgi:stage V sporulation protein AA